MLLGVDDVGLGNGEENKFKMNVGELFEHN